MKDDPISLNPVCPPASFPALPRLLHRRDIPTSEAQKELDELRRVNLLKEEIFKIRCGAPIPIAQGVWAPMEKRRGS